SRHDSNDPRHPRRDVVADAVGVGLRETASAFGAGVGGVQRDEAEDNRQNAELRRPKQVPHGLLRSQNSTRTPPSDRGWRNAMRVPWLPARALRSISSKPAWAARVSAASMSWT